MKKVLCDLGVPTIQFVTYRGFSLHVDKLCRDYSEEALRLRVLYAIQRWARYGCKLDVLTAICLNVFALDLLPKP